MLHISLTLFFAILDILGESYAGLDPTSSSNVAVYWGQYQVVWCAYYSADMDSVQVRILSASMLVLWHNKACLTTAKVSRDTVSVAE